MKRMTISDLPLSGLKLVIRQRQEDRRGFFSRVFCSDELAIAGWSKPIAQINHSASALCGTVRGMHFQHRPHAEMKLISCIRGEVWDVAVDVRVDSPTFLQWHAEHLSADNARALLIPEGFAHGFQTLTDNVELLYFHSSAFTARAEGGLHPRDARLSIQWPLPISQLSARDAAHPLIDSTFKGVRL